MKFSVITPLYIYDQKRADDFVRCLFSLNNQTFSDFESVVVDQTEKKDFDLFPILAEKKVFYKSITYKQDHTERLFALRKAFEVAKGEWFCFLDSDDIYLPHYLETVNAMIKEHPESKMFNFGSIHIHKDGRVTPRDAFKPKKLEIGHEEFAGGVIVNGTYVFHRSLWEELGDWPKIEKLWNPWDFSIAAQEEFPELKKYFIVDHPDHPEGCPKELGNPWGQDFYLFYKYTRKYHSLPEDKHLYGVYQK